MKKSLLSVGLVLAAVVSGEAFGFRKFLDQFGEHYDANNISTQIMTDETSCGLCHVRAGGGGKRNPYGEDFRNIALNEGKSFPGIEFIDSDKDGYMNLEEIFLQTLPGSPENAPAGRIQLALKDSNTLTLSVSVSCVELNLKAFGFKFENDASELNLNNVTDSRELKISGTQGAILAKCEVEKLTGSLLR